MGKTKMKKKVMLAICLVIAGLAIAQVTGIKCARCTGTGKIDRKVTCTVCNGTGEDKYDKCYNCNGRGYVYEKVTCPDCKGEGTINEPVPFPEPKK